MGQWWFDCSLDSLEVLDFFVRLVKLVEYIGQRILTLGCILGKYVDCLKLSLVNLNPYVGSLLGSCLLYTSDAADE